MKDPAGLNPLCHPPLPIIQDRSVLRAQQVMRRNHLVCRKLVGVHQRGECHGSERRCVPFCLVFYQVVVKGLNPPWVF